MSSPNSSGTGPAESASADSVANHGMDVDALGHGLRRLGVPAARSKQIIGAAIVALPAAELTEAAVLRRAPASI